MTEAGSADEALGRAKELLERLKATRDPPSARRVLTDRHGPRTADGALLRKRSGAGCDGSGR